MADPRRRARRRGHPRVTLFGPIRQRGIRAGVAQALQSQVVRVLLGLAISALFLAVTISRVDIGETLTALLRPLRSGSASRSS